MSKEIVLVMGYPASGKTSHTKGFVKIGYTRLNRDDAGGKVIDLVPRMIAALSNGVTQIVIDNTFPTVESRKPFIDAATIRKIPIRCVHVDTSIEDAQLNACLRMIRKNGSLLMPGDKQKDPNTFPIVVTFKYRKAFERPTVEEGFSAGPNVPSVAKVKFLRRWGPEYKNKALIFDYDGTLRKSVGALQWPEEPGEVELLPDRLGILDIFRETSYHLLGVSNQSACAKSLSAEAAEACFEKTNALLGFTESDDQIDYLYCPHRANPPNCWCRKPQVGLGAVFIEKYKLDPSKCFMIGDMTSDKTFATRCGFNFWHADEFFGRKKYKEIEV